MKIVLHNIRINITYSKTYISIYEILSALEDIYKYPDLNREYNLIIKGVYIEVRYKELNHLFKMSGSAIKCISYFNSGNINEISYIINILRSKTNASRNT